MILIICLIFIQCFIIGWGFYRLVFTDLVFTWTCCILFFLLPLLSICLEVIIAKKRKSMGTKKTVLFTCLVTVLWLLLSLSWLSLGTLRTMEVNRNISPEEKLPLSSLNQVIDEPILEEAESISLYQFFEKSWVFFTHADTCICRFPQDAFEDKKHALQTAYRLPDNDPVTGPWIVEDFCFFWIKMEDYDDYPKELLLWGFNDRTKEFAWIHFRDQDLDYIDSMQDFISENCGWRYIMTKRA